MTKINSSLDQLEAGTPVRTPDTPLGLESELELATPATLGENCARTLFLNSTLGGLAKNHFLSPTLEGLT